MPPTTSSPARPSRVYAIDTAKGIGIIFVVFGHAWRGAFDAGLLSDAPLFQWIDGLIYAWHMPLFFFLSGLIFLSAAVRTRAVDFVTGRIWRLMLPMVLWTWIFFAIKILAGKAANHPVTIADFPFWPLPPYEHLWFLWALLLIQLVALPLCLGLRAVVSARGLAVALALLSVVLALMIPHLAGSSAYFDAAIAHLPYFLAGIAVGGVAHLRPPAWAAALAALAFGLVLFGTLPAWTLGVRSVGLVLLVWVVVSFLDANKRDAGALLRGLRYLGQASLAIYLAHTIFSAAIRIGLTAGGVTSLSWHLIAATAVGIVCPIIMLWVTDRLALTRPLGLSRG